MEDTAENYDEKAYRAFCTSTDTFDKTQGLKPSMLHWIYNRVF